MQIVIDISNYDVEWINNAYCIPSEISSKIADAIINGTPLPKGHGRLIDADALKLSEEEHTEMGEYNWNVEHTYYTRYYSVKEIKNAPTIIEADKEV